MLLVRSLMLLVSDLPPEKSLEVFNQIYQLAGFILNESFPQLVSVSIHQHFLYQ